MISLLEKTKEMEYSMPQEQKGKQLRFNQNKTIVKSTNSMKQYKEICFATEHNTKH